MNSFNNFYSLGNTHLNDSGLLSVVHPRLGMNITNYTGSGANFDKDIAYLKSLGITRVRIYHPTYTNSSAITAAQAQVVKCLNAGFEEVLYGVTAADNGYSSSLYPAFETESLNQASWAAGLNNPRLFFSIGNEEERHMPQAQSLSQSAGLATMVTKVPHTFTTGNTITVNGASPTGYNGAVVITVVNPTTFTYSVSSGLASPATGTIYASDLTQTQIGDRMAVHASNVKTAYPNLKVIYTTIPAQVATWTSRGKGLLDRIAFNFYENFPPDFTNNTNAAAAGFGSNGFASEFGPHSNGLSGSGLTNSQWEAKFLSEFQQLKKISLAPMYIYAFMDSGNNFGVKKTDGTFQSWWPKILSGGI